MAELIKKKTILYFLTFFLVFTTFSCGGGVDDPYIPTNPDITSALKNLYPNVTDVTWSKKGKYEVADCYVNDVELHVWFNVNATWVMTEEEIFRTQLPDAVEEAYSKSEYANWVIDNLTKLTFPSRSTLYLFEVQSGDKEYALFYTADGTLDLKESITDANNTYWPDMLGL